MLKHGMQTTIAHLLCAQQHKGMIMNIVGWKPNKRKLSPLTVIGGAAASFGLGLANSWSRADDSQREKFPQWFKDLHKKINPEVKTLTAIPAPAPAPAIDSTNTMDSMPPTQDAPITPLPDYVPSTPEEEHANAWSEPDTLMPEETMPPDYSTDKIVNLAGGN